MVCDQLGVRKREYRSHDTLWKTAFILVVDRHDSGRTSPVAIADIGKFGFEV